MIDPMYQSEPASKSETSPADPLVLHASALSHETTDALARRSKLARPAIVTGVLGAAVVLSVILTSSHADSPTAIAINGASADSTFDGVGAISGGGGNSRYVPDYPATQQAQMMDYLFKPNYGASLQILKVEIGGDTNSTDGAEPSIEHAAGSINCNAGYEWQMMQQAKSRNSNIKLYGLAWGAPGWISGHTFYSNDTINYLLAWMNCAKQKGLTIDYIGGQNEKAYNATWYKSFRTALNNAGYTSTKLVAADQFPSSTGATYNWQNTYNIAADMSSDPALKSAIGVVGAHDVCGYPTDGLQCYATDTAKGLGVPLWMSEAGHMDGNAGAANIARSFNRGYQDAKLTGYIQWPLLNAMPPGLSHEVYGLLTADEPWSGYYAANRQLWAFAHTTQFTAPGWSYVNAGTGFLGNDRANGSFVTYKSPNGSDWSLVAETTTSVAQQPISASISGGLNAAGPVHVWATNVKSSNPSDWFQQLADVTPTNGGFTYTLQPGYLYSFTTTTGQSKGNAGAASTASTLKLPYSDTFATMDSSNQAKYFAAQSGAFEGAACAGGVSGICLQQNTPTNPINWGSSATPYTLIGDNSWTNYTVASSVLFKSSGSSAGVIGRFGKQAGNPGNFNGYLLQINDAGTWNIYKNNNGGSATSLASGSVASLGTSKWHTVSLKLQGSTLTASIDGTQVGTATDGAYTYGPAGLDTGAFTNIWSVVQFRNFSVTGSQTAGFTGPIYAGLIDRCLDDYQGSTANGAKVDLYSCNYNNSQNWNIPGDGTIRVGGKCLDIYQAGTTDGAKVDLYSCNGGANQQWQATNGTLVNPVSGKCLDDPGSTTVLGTQIDIKTCDGSLGQYWTLPQ
jgi:hypothetical protein